MLSLPFALIGSSWLLFLLDDNFSVAVAVGRIALAGVAAEFGVIMLIFLSQPTSSSADTAQPRGFNAQL